MEKLYGKRREKEQDENPQIDEIGKKKKKEKNEIKRH